ncbi:MAG: hypothetical protein FGM45_07395 [Actinobacteria bacterium]|nr:hypothetical protein [Actinomycetota bacterium]
MTDSGSLGASSRVFPALPLSRLVLRAIVRRCPRCGSRRAWFRSWFAQGERCVGCGLRRTRGVDGHELGALTIGLVLNIGLVIAAVGIAVALTVPDVPVVTLYVILASAAIVIPVVTWPLTHTIWIAIDLRVRPVSDDEAAEAAAWLAGRDGQPS